MRSVWASNADSLAPRIARELVPVLSWQMATQPLPQAVRASVIPGRQAMSDTHGDLHFARYDARHRLVSGGLDEVWTRTEAVTPAPTLERQAA